MKADNKVTQAILTALSGLSLGFLMAATWTGDTRAILVFLPITWLCLALWLSADSWERPDGTTTKKGVPTPVRVTYMPPVAPKTDLDGSRFDNRG